MGISLQGTRQRTYEILERGSANGPLDNAVHWGLIALILVNVVAVVLGSVPAVASTYEGLLAGIEALSVVIFTAEYALRLWSAPEHTPWQDHSPWRARLNLAFQPMAVVDLVAIAPFYLALFTPLDLRALLVLRLLRFFKLARYSPGLASLSDAVHSERRGLAASFVILVGTTLVAASLMHVVEGEVQPDTFGTIPDAMYWAVVTLTTVGYGDVVPVTPLGKLIAGLSAVTGLVMLALPVGLLASAFAREIQRRDFVVTWSMLARVPIFANLDAAELNEIMDYLHAKHCGRDEVVLRRGEPAEAMYFIASGRVAIELQPEPVVLEAGDFFGERAILSRSERTATVRALTPCKLLVLDARDLAYLMDHAPRMAERIRRVTESRAASDEQGRLQDRPGDGAAMPAP
ncbi:MAG TPA: cyclic nucleotide-gated ion channel [Microvirga sp.]|jgi:voltage-gated potassium channel